MEVIYLIISGLAFVGTAVNLLLFLREKKQVTARFAAMVDYIDKADDLCLQDAKNAVNKAIGKAGSGWKRSLEEAQKASDEKDAIRRREWEALREKLEGMNARLAELLGRVNNLEQGGNPDYNAAVAAKEAIDSFSQGVMNILAYGDPPPKKREKEGEGR